MNMFEEAEAIRGTIKLCRATQTEMAKRLGVSQSYIANKLRLLQLDEETRARVLEYGLTERHARSLLRLDSKERSVAIEEIRRRGLNVASTELMIDTYTARAAPRLIGAAERGRCIDEFKDTLKRSVITLRSMGVDAGQTISRHGGKTYITVAIEEA